MRALLALTVCLALGSALLQCNLNPQPFPPQDKISNNNGAGGPGGAGGGASGGGSSGAGTETPTVDASTTTSAAADASAGNDSGTAPVAVQDGGRADGSRDIAEGGGPDAMGSCESCSRADAGATEEGSTGDSASEAAPDNDALDESDSGPDSASGTGP